MRISYHKGIIYPLSKHMNMRITPNTMGISRGYNNNNCFHAAAHFLCRACRSLICSPCGITPLNYDPMVCISLAHMAGQQLIKPAEKVHMAGPAEILFPLHTTPAYGMGEEGQSEELQAQTASRFAGHSSKQSWRHPCFHAAAHFLCRACRSLICSPCGITPLNYDPMVCISLAHMAGQQLIKPAEKVHMAGPAEILFHVPRPAVLEAWQR